MTRLRVSTEAIDCVKKMLTKDPKKRIELNDLLKHPWLTRNCEKVRQMREAATLESVFRMNSLTEPLTKGGEK